MNNIYSEGDKLIATNHIHNYVHKGDQLTVQSLRCGDTGHEYLCETPEGLLIWIYQGDLEKIEPESTPADKIRARIRECEHFLAKTRTSHIRYQYVAGKLTGFRMALGYLEPGA